MARKMPAQRPGKSEQTVCTPPEFLSAVYRRLSIVGFRIDLAASSENTVAGLYWDEAVDSLSMDWPSALVAGGWAWLNPPYANIAPWVEKAAKFAALQLPQAGIAVLVPASVGSNWWRDHVDRKALVLLLNGRITFVGHTHPYPKDLALLLYGHYITPGYEVWRWNED